MKYSFFMAVSGNKYDDLHSRGKWTEILEYSLTQEGVEARYWELVSLFMKARIKEFEEKLKEYEHLFVEDIWRSKYLGLIGNTHRYKNTKKALDYYKQAIDIAERIDYKRGMIDYYYNSGIIMRNQNDDEGDKFIEKAYEMSQEIDFKIGILRHHASSGNYFRSRGDFEEALKHLEKADEICKEMGNDQAYSSLLGSFALYYFDTREFDKALSYADQSYKLSIEVDNLWGIRMSLSIMAQIYFDKGMMDKSLEYYKKMHEINLKIGDPIEIAISLGNMALIYMNKGDLEDSLNIFEEILPIMKEVDQRVNTAAVLTNIGLIYIEMGDIEKAESYFEEAYQLRIEINNQRFISGSLFNLITILSISDRGRAKIYLDKLEKIENVENNSNITFLFNFAKVLYLKSSNSLRDKIPALLLLEDVIKQVEKEGSDIYFAIPHLVELLLLEYQSSSDKEVMDNISRYLDIQYNGGLKQKRYPLQIEALLMKSQLAQIEGNFIESDQLLNEANSLCIEKNLGRLLGVVEKAKNDTNSEMERMQKLIRNNASFAEKLKRSNMMAYVKMAQDSISNMEP